MHELDFIYHSLVCQVHCRLISIEQNYFSSLHESIVKYNLFFYSTPPTSVCDHLPSIGETLFIGLLYSWDDQ